MSSVSHQASSVSLIFVICFIQETSAFYWQTTTDGQTQFGNFLFTLANEQNTGKFVIREIHVTNPKVRSPTGNVLRSDSKDTPTKYTVEPEQISTPQIHQLISILLERMNATDKTNYF